MPHSPHLLPSWVRRLGAMTDVELRLWLEERARRFAPFRSFVFNNKDHLRKIAESTPELRWMLKYIGFVVGGVP